MLEHDEMMTSCNRACNISNFSIKHACLQIPLIVNFDLLDVLPLYTITVAASAAPANQPAQLQVRFTYN